MPGIVQLHFEWSKTSEPCKDRFKFVIFTVNGIGQTDKQVNNAPKDLVKRFLSETRKLEERNG